MKSSLKGFPYTSSGISYIEAALAVPLLIYATIFTIDIARWIATKVVLQYAAYKGADIAQKIDITRNISEENCSSNPSDCAVHWNSAYQITYTAYNIASMIAGTDPERDSIVLYKWNHFDPSLMSSPNQSWNTMASGMETITYAGFIRPGEAVWEITPDNAHQTPIPNPARPYGTDHNQGFPNRFYNEDSRMYQKYPFAVMLKARVKTFTPFMPDWTASATVMSYASPSPGEGTPSSVSGSCGDNICEASELCSCQPDCAILCPQVGPSPSPSPTVTPSPSPSPSPTPTPTPSPSPTCGDGIVQNPPEECETDSDCLA
ncbi:MAG: pilus assembly protein, partial [Candidatus Dadabacteria bacterium]